jgi:pimeloyl-ACP methyl ester carboxylesterase
MQLIQIYRTRFRSGIVAEFLPPQKESSQKVAILAPGAPGYPGSKVELMMLLSRKGFFTFLPRYRGTWESDGTFLEHSPHEDIVSMIDELQLGFQDVWSSAEYRIHAPEVYLIGGSFGGAASILASRDSRVKKAVGISAVTDWRDQQHTVEPLNLMSEYVEKAFGPTYRGVPYAWEKLTRGDFYNPTHEQTSIDGKKLLLIHAKDDKVVHANPAELFAKVTGAKFVLLSSGGHMGVGSAKEQKIWKHIEKFFNAR